MPTRKIVNYPSKILRKPISDVLEFDDSLSELTRDMFDTMYEAEGVGLAAPQIGISLRLFVMDCDGVKLIAANPEIASYSGEQTGEEGCLSIGKVPGELIRPQTAILQAQDVEGNAFLKEAHGYAARCFLHETDHCNGILFIDRLKPVRRDIITRRFRKLLKSKG